MVDPVLLFEWSIESATFGTIVIGRRKGSAISVKIVQMKSTDRCYWQVLRARAPVHSGWETHFHDAIHIASVFASESLNAESDARLGRSGSIEMPAQLDENGSHLFGLEG